MTPAEHLEYLRQTELAMDTASKAYSKVLPYARRLSNRAVNKHAAAVYYLVMGLMYAKRDAYWAKYLANECYIRWRSLVTGADGNMPTDEHKPSTFPRAICQTMCDALNERHKGVLIHWPEWALWTVPKEGDSCLTK